MTENNPVQYRVETFDYFAAGDGWTLEWGTNDLVDAVLAARKAAYVGMDIVKIVDTMSNLTVYTYFHTDGVICLPPPEWVLCTNNYEMWMVKGALQTPSMPSPCNETWQDSFRMQFLEAAQAMENHWNNK